MEIPSSPEQIAKTSNSASTTSSVTAVRPAELLSQLQAGQTLLAKVENLLANNQVELRIATNLVKADSPIPLTQGQTIKLLVEDSNNGLILRIAAQTNQVETVTKALRIALPKQQPIIDVIKQLVNNITSNKIESANNQVAQQLRIAIQALVNTLPSAKTVSNPDGLRQAVQNSGVTLEAQLRQAIITGTTPRTDSNLKANFLRLAQVALQIQADSKQNVTPTRNEVSTPPLATGKSNPIDAYTSLLTSSNKKTFDGDKSLLPLRPLLPPVPTSTPTVGDTQSPKNITTSLQGLLQRLFSFTPINTNQAASNIPSTTAPQSPASQQIFSTMLVELLNQMESGLARIQQHQLSNITSDDAIRHFLNLELPVFNGKTFDNIGVRFEWEKHQTDEDDNDKQHQWKVVLNFDFDEQGKTQAIIRAEKDAIHTEFKSEHPETQTAFQNNQELLKQGLQKQGLTPGQCTFSTGHITPDPLNNRNNLVETKA